MNSVKSAAELLDYVEEVINPASILSWEPLRKRIMRLKGVL